MEETAVEEIITINQLVQIETLDSQIAALEEQRTEVRMAIKDRMKAEGLKTVNTDSGTVSLMTKTRYNTADWDSFKDFILEHAVVDLLEKRIAQSNMATFLEENPGVVPPGLNSVTEFDIRVTKSRK
mgnify:CR=1 FL=1